MRKKFPIALMLLVLLSACQYIDTENQEETDPAEEFVMKVRGADRLYTTEYVVNKIVTYDDIVRLRGSVFSKSFDFKLPQGNRKVLIPMQAHIKAYIDFSSFSEDNVVLTDSTATITLPDPAVVLTSTKIDHAGVRTYVDFGRSTFSNTELAEFERQGRAAIISAIPQMGIVETAREHAYRFLLPMIEAMGYEPDQITVNFSKQYSDADYLNNLIRESYAQ